MNKARQASKSTTDDPLVTENLVDFITSQMIIPETGEALDLHPEQTAVLKAMNARDEHNNLKYSTWLYSAPKKSAKTTIGAGVALWQAWRVPNGEIYIIGNDLKQADNRMAQAIRYCVEHNPLMRDRVRVTTSKYKIELDNGTRIEAIPVDPRGEAGMNPTGLFWTEAWGAMGKAAELLWTEAALSPTRAGQSFKFVDSYAGFIGESLLLERLYNGIVKEGVPDDAIPELYRRGGSIAYWCTRRYLDWQTNDAGRAYYAQESVEKTAQEFGRVHDNQWASSVEAFVPVEWWDACIGDLPALGTNQPIVVALDAAVSGDCFAIVGVSRVSETVYVRFARQWTPPLGGKILYSDPNNPTDMDTPEGYCRWIKDHYNVAVWCYDEYQLHDFATRLGRQGLGFFEPFPQGGDRLVADKMLYDCILNHTMVHDGNPDLRAHIQNANRKADGDKLRIVKRVEHGMPIDLAVSLSMSNERARFYNIG